MPNNNNNPFLRPDPLEPWFDKRVELDILKKKGWNEYRSTRNMKKTYVIEALMTLYSNIKLFAVHHVAAFITTLVLIFSATVALSAQAFAPDELKPTTIINSLFVQNEVPQKDPYTSLSPDANYNVIDLKRCDLAMKYPRLIEDAEVNPDDYSAYMDGPESERIGATLFYGIPPSKANDKTTIGQIHVSCYSKPQENTPDSYYEVQTDPVTLTREELREKFGWFITEGEITNITYRTEELVNGIWANYKNIHRAQITFEYNNIFYSIYGHYTTGEVQTIIIDPNAGEFLGSKKGIFLNQVQFQFQSLVKNETNVSLETPTDNTKKINNQPTASPEIAINNPPTIQSPIISDKFDTYSLIECGDFSFGLDTSTYQLGFSQNEELLGILDEQEQAEVMAFVEESQKIKCPVDNSNPTDAIQILSVYPKNTQIDCYYCDGNPTPHLFIEVGEGATEVFRQNETVSIGAPFDETDSNILALKSFVKEDKVYTTINGINGNLYVVDFGENEAYFQNMPVTYKGKYSFFEFTHKGTTWVIIRWSESPNGDQLFSDTLDSLKLS